MMELPARAPAPSDSSGTPIRVTIVQPALPSYRIPIFRELASRPGIQLRVVYGSVAGLENVTEDGFEAVYSPRTVWSVLGQSVMIHRAEWIYCSRRYSDVVVLRWAGRSACLLPGILRARAGRVPVVLWGHGYSKRERRWWATIRNWGASLATSIVFYDPETRDAFVSKGWNADKLFVALNSIDQSRIESAKRSWLQHDDELAQFRREHHLDQGPVILFVSRLSPANRVDLLVRATARLAPDFPSLKTVIIGSGVDERRELERLVKSLGVEHNVLFQDGIYDELRLAPWFLSATVFCYPANIGLSLIHSFWYGLPVVTSDHRPSHNPEIVALEQEVNGELYQHENLDSLADSLKKVIENGPLRNRMSMAAFETVKDRFTVPKMVDGLEQAIRSACRRSAVVSA